MDLYLPTVTPVPRVAKSTGFIIHHTFKDLPVWGSESVLVTDAARSLKARVDLNGVPTLSNRRAIELVVSRLAPHGIHHHQPQARLFPAPIMSMHKRNAYWQRPSYMAQIAVKSLQSNVRLLRLTSVPMLLVSKGRLPKR